MLMFPIRSPGSAYCKLPREGLHDCMHALMDGVAARDQTIKDLGFQLGKAEQALADLRRAYEYHKGNAERLKQRCAAMELLLYPDPNNPADWDCCDEHETTFPKGGECPRCVEHPGVSGS